MGINWISMIHKKSQPFLFFAGGYLIARYTITDILGSYWLSIITYYILYELSFTSICLWYKTLTGSILNHNDIGLFKHLVIHTEVIIVYCALVSLIASGSYILFINNYNYIIVSSILTTLVDRLCFEIPKIHVLYERMYKYIWQYFIKQSSGTCPICWETIECYFLPCHETHRVCLKCLSNFRQNICPVCRKDISNFLKQLDITIRQYNTENDDLL